jgi:hypothetical protein
MNYCVQRKISKYTEKSNLYFEKLSESIIGYANKYEEN